MFSARKRGRIFAKTDGHCGYCGVKLDPFVDWHADHMTPRRLGSGGEDNLVPSCPSCNSRKQSKDIEEFRAFVKGTMLTHVDSLTGPYLRYMTPETADELRKVSRRVRELVEDASIVFYLDHCGE